MTRTAILKRLAPNGDVADALCRECGRVIALVVWKVTEDATRVRVTRGYVAPERGLVERPKNVAGLPTFGPPTDRRHDGKVASHGAAGRPRAPGVTLRANADAQGIANVAFIYCSGCGAGNEVDARGTPLIT